MEKTMEALTLNEPDTTDNDNSMPVDTPESGPIPQPFSFIKEISYTQPFYGLNDFVLLPDRGVVVSTAHKRSVFKFNASAECVAQYRFEKFEPFGVCLMGNGNIIVSQPRTNKLVVLNGEDLKEIYNFSFDKSYKSLSTDDGERLICAFRGLGDLSLHFDFLSKKNNPKGEYQIERCVCVPSGTPTCSLYWPRLMPCSENILVVRPAKTPKVICFNYESEVQFRFESGPEEDNPILNISDIAVTKDFIYIADKNSKKITRLRTDGTFVDTMCPSEDHAEMAPIKLFINKEGVLAVLLYNPKEPIVKLYSI